MVDIEEGEGMVEMAEGGVVELGGNEVVGEEEEEEEFDEEPDEDRG